MKTIRSNPLGRAAAWVAAALLAGALANADVVTKPVQTFGYGDVAAMTVSRDGQFLVTGGLAGAFLWDVQAAKVIRKFATDGPPVSCVALSADGKRLVTDTLGWYGWSAVTLWDMDTGQKLRTFERITNGVNLVSVACSPDGSQVAAGGSDGTTRVWDVATGGLRFTLAGSLVEFSPDGRLLVVAGESSTLVVNATTGQAGHSLNITRPRGSPWVAPSFSPDGSRVLVSGTVWNTETGQQISGHRSTAGGELLA